MVKDTVCGMVTLMVSGPVLSPEGSAVAGARGLPRRMTTDCSDVDSMPPASVAVTLITNAPPLLATATSGRAATKGLAAVPWPLAGTKPCLEMRVVAPDRSNTEKDQAWASDTVPAWRMGCVERW